MVREALRKTKSLRDEIRQSKPFDSAAQEAILALYRTSDMLRRRFSQLVEPHGISLQQYNVLRILRGAGKTGTPTLDIADRMIEMTPGVTRLLDKLESQASGSPGAMPGRPAAGSVLDHAARVAFVGCTRRSHGCGGGQLHGTACPGEQRALIECARKTAGTFGVRFFPEIHDSSSILGRTMRWWKF